MDKAANLYYSVIQVTDEHILRQLLNTYHSEKDLSEIYKLLIVHSPREPIPVNTPIDILKKQLETQKTIVDDAVRYKYIVERLTKQYKWTPLLAHFLHTADKYITAETSVYQVLLNQLQSKIDITAQKRQRRKRKKEKKRKTYTWDPWADVENNGTIV